MKIILLAFLLLTKICVAQTGALDSLEAKLAVAPNDETRLNLLTALMNVSFENNLKRSLDYARRGIQMAEKINDIKAQPALYEMEGRIHANLLQLDTAMLFFHKAMAGYKSIGNKKGQASTLFRVAWVYKRKQEIDKGMEADMKALKLMEDINDVMGIASALGRVSDGLTRQGRLKEALEYAEKAIALCKKNNLNEELMLAYFNAASATIALEDYPASLQYYDNAIAICTSLNFGNMRLSDFTNGRGNALKRLGRLPEALAEYKKAQVLALKTNYTLAINTVIANLGEVYLLMGNYAEALKYQLQTIANQESAGDNSNLVENYLHASTIYEKLGNYPLALVYQKKALLLRDSTASKASDLAMSELLTKYETEKKQATIATQQHQLKQQSRVQWLSIGVVILLGGFLVFGFRSYRARTKANKLLAAKNAENVLLLKEIHHRVKNNLEVVSSLLALQSAQIDDPNTKDAMQEGQNRVQSIGIVHQKLYQGENLGAIEMKDYFLNLGESILDSFGAAARVNIELAMEKLDVDIDTAVPLGLIVNELLTNTLKYAFPDGKKGKVIIKLNKAKSGVLQLEVSDNGVGKSGEIKGTGFGGQLITLLTRQLDGVMKEEVNNGTHTYFEFKRGRAA